MNHWLTLTTTKFTLTYSIYHGDSLKSWLDLVSLTNFKVSARLLKLGKKRTFVSVISHELRLESYHICLDISLGQVKLIRFW